jgi:hypothetical protein
MKTEIGRKLDALDRVLAHCAANPYDDPGFNAVVAKLQEGVKRAKALTAQQLDGTRNDRAAAVQKRTLRAAVHRDFLITLARSAVTASEEEAGLEAIFKLPRIAGQFKLWHLAAERMAAEAEMRKELLSRHGFSGAKIAGLKAALVEFEVALNRRVTSVSAHVGATADLDAVMATNMAQVKILDGLNVSRFSADPEALAAWESARNFFGPVITRPDAPPEGGPARTAA